MPSAFVRKKVSPSSPKVGSLSYRARCLLSKLLISLQQPSSLSAPREMFPAYALTAAWSSFLALNGIHILFRRSRAARSPSYGRSGKPVVLAYGEEGRPGRLLSSSRRARWIPFPVPRLKMGRLSRGALHRVSRVAGKFTLKKLECSKQA